MIAIRLMTAAVALSLAACGTQAPSKTASADPTPSPRTSPPAHGARSMDGCLKEGPGVRFVHIRQGGVTLRAAILGRGRLGVVLSNQSGANLCEWLPFGRKIAARHQRALLFDANGSAEAASAAAVRLRSSGARQIVVMGASVGAVASIRAAAGEPRDVDGLVSVSAERIIGGDVKPDAEQVRVPALFISARGDASAASATRLFYRVAPSPDKHLLMLPGSLHGESLFSGPQRARVEATVLRFLARLDS